VNPPIPSLAEMAPLYPALLLTGGAILLLLSEVFAAGHSRAHQPVLAALATAAAGVAAVQGLSGPSREILQGFGVADPFSAFITLTVCAGVFLVIPLSASFLRAREAERGEFYALVLFAAAGMSLLALSNELITLFINLEVLSVAVYALAAYLRRGPRHAEAGLKYFILGAFSTALFLYGAALLYGAARTTHLPELGARLTEALARTPGLVYAGAGFIAAGLAFKVAAVPFHMWAPDVYEGAPTPVTAFMSAGVKTAAFAALLRVFVSLGHSLSPTFGATLWGGLALFTMVGGNLLALPQRNVKRMLAYSSIAHAGYVLLGVASLFGRPGGAAALRALEITPLVAGAAADPQAMALRGILFYLLAYTLTTLGAFGLAGALEQPQDEERGTAWDLEHYAGLAQRKPAWAAAMTVLMLSLAGIPPTAGFFGKLLIFRSAVDAGFLHLAVVGILTSAAGAYYYLRIVVYMFMRPAPQASKALPSPAGVSFALLLSTVGVVALGIAPGALGDWLSQAGAMFGTP